jgi:hypothetical protein
VRKPLQRKGAVTKNAPLKGTVCRRSGLSEEALDCERDKIKMYQS